VPSLPPIAPGARVDVEVKEIDLIEASFRCVFRGPRVLA
jgi:hypothetical protein